MGRTVAPSAAAPWNPERREPYLTASGWLILAYVVITRIGHLEAAKLGGPVGGVPIFLTEIFLLLTTAALLVARPVSLFGWAAGGGGAGPVGRIVWLIAILASVHFAISFSQYRIYAARDYAIFMYALFFVLAYFALPRTADAVRLLRWTIYAGIVAAIALLGVTILGIRTELFDESSRFVLGTQIASRGGGDVGGIVAFSLAGLGSYIVLQRRRRLIHGAGAIICFAALSISQTRSAVFGLVLAATFSVLALGRRHRIAMAALAVIAIGVLIVSPALPDYIPGVRSLQNFYYAVASGTQFTGDGNAQFRLLRWNLALQTWLDNPLFGVGFGTPILPLWIENIEDLNTFNYGLPHNTFLTILARTGILGLALFLVPVILTLHRIYRLMRIGAGNADLLAVANIIVTMVGFGLFVLFFERPLHGATFWIVLAIAARAIAGETVRAVRPPG